MPMNPRLLRPRASGFNPKSIANLEGWWDAADASTVTLDSGRVSAWADKSGKGRTMSNSTSGSTQPDYITAARNGRNVIRFAAASTQRLQSAGTSTHNFLHNGTPSTVLVVCKAGNSADPQALLGIMGNSAGGVSTNIGFFAAYDDRTSANAALNNFPNIGIVTGTNSVFVARTAIQGAYTNTFAPNAYSVITLSLDLTNATAAERIGFAQNNAALTKANVDTGSPSSSNASFAMQYGTIGNNLFPFDGDFCEVLMYSQHPTDADIEKLQGYLAWKWGLQAQLPYNHRYARSFPGFGSQSVPSDPDTLTYLSAMATADGRGVEVGVANAIESFITGCKSDGTWTAIKASCILMGARTLSGALTPLVGTAPTNVNFVSGDYNRKTGLVGDGSTKYLNTNRNLSTSDSQDSHHAAVLPTVFAAESATPSSDFGPMIAARASATAAGAVQALHAGPNSGTPNLLTFVSTNAGFTAGKAAGTLAGLSRSASGSFVQRHNGSSTTNTDTSQSLANTNWLVFARTVGGSGEKYTTTRLGFYSIGTSVDLSLLDTRVSALYTAIGAAIP